MTIQRLIKQLRREATANPKKAGVLGLLVLVALYFWFPVVTDWLNGTGSSARRAASAAGSGSGTEEHHSGAEGAGLAAPPFARDNGERSAGEGTAGPAWRWEELASWRESDPRTAPLREWSLARDPFRRENRAAATVEQAPPQAVAATATPESLGLVLSGTIVSEERRAAVIGGRVYTEGNRVELVRDGEPIAFQLTRIGPRRVVLERQGEHYELVLPERGITGRFELSRMEP